MLLISGCAQPEINSTSNTSAVTEIQNQSYDVAQEQGRHIEKDLKMKDSDIKVNAQVIVTADQVQQGKLELVNPSLKEIENLFEIKYPLEKTDNLVLCCISGKTNLLTTAFSSHPLCRLQHLENWQPFEDF